MCRSLPRCFWSDNDLLEKHNTQEAIAAFDLLRQADLPKSCKIAATQNAILARGAQGVDLMVEQLKSSDLDFFQTGLAAARILPGEPATKSLIDLLGFGNVAQSDRFC